MKKIPLSLAFAASATLFALTPVPARAAQCAAEYHDFETAVETAEHVCFVAPHLCDYARQIVIEKGDAYRECMAREHGLPVS
ncbi:hypothetical protein DFR29_11177 [Tahibacter aquaticus]|uniref:Cysteine rich repeat protein n=1 Tax=Tahibacter aquaticus TaxID=520092 RepID=A0A4R6YSD4_9GAMM|nr:hypothetical protein [Tahibacter aquaticus]TDR41165.1 hypothetical protein DFR29_11177 [Tahibacter aquaticus]